jgi:hypothetical protein
MYLFVTARFRKPRLGFPAFILPQNELFPSLFGIIILVLQVARQLSPFFADQDDNACGLCQQSINGEHAKCDVED